MDQIDINFLKFHKSNPKVYEVFKRFAFEALMSGLPSYGSKAIMERVRWELNITTRGDRFKINNNYSSRYARMLISEHPQFDGFIHTRALASEREAA